MVRREGANELRDTEWQIETCRLVVEGPMSIEEVEEGSVYTWDVCATSTLISRSLGAASQNYKAGHGKVGKTRSPLPPVIRSPAVTSLTLECAMHVVINYWTF